MFLYNRNKNNMNCYFVVNWYFEYLLLNGNFILRYFFKVFVYVYLYIMYISNLFDDLIFERKWMVFVGFL